MGERGRNERGGRIKEKETDWRNEREMKKWE